MINNKVIIAAAMVLQMASYTHVADAKKAMATFSGDSSTRGTSSALSRIKVIKQTLEDMSSPCVSQGGWCAPTTATMEVWNNFFSATRVPSFLGMNAADILNVGAAALIRLSAGGAASSRGPYWAFNGGQGAYASVYLFDFNGTFLSPVDVLGNTYFSTNKGFNLSAGSSGYYSPESMVSPVATRVGPGAYWAVVVNYLLVDGKAVPQFFAPNTLSFVDSLEGYSIGTPPIPQ